MSEQYYIWEYRLEGKTGKPPMLHKVNEIRGITFQDGERIDKKIPPVTFIANSTQKFTDYLFNIPGFPLFSGKLKGVIDEFGINSIQYFPVLIKDKKGKVLRDDYVIANVIEMVKCFNYGHSVCDEEDYRDLGIASRIEKLSIDISAIKGEHLFRMDEAPRLLFASDALRLKLEDSGITGIQYINIEDYRD